MSFKESQFISRIRKLSKKGRDVIVGIGDDAAVLPYNRTHYLLWAQDTIVESVHFKKGTLPRDIGWKALARNISDIAAMGGIAKYALVSAGIPRGYNLSRCMAVYRGMGKLAKLFGIQIIGGDTVASPCFSLTVSIMGVVEKNNLTLRSGARPGDAILCTGSLGGSIYGKHLRFMPRQKEARWLVENFKIHSMIDISDGLAGDLGHIIRESGCGAVLYEEKIPLSDVLSARKSGFREKLTKALYDGEDYELLFTTGVSATEKILKGSGAKRIPVSLIGRITPGQSLYLKNSSGRRKKILPIGFEHKN